MQRVREDIRETLTNTGRAMIELADKLSEHGQPLTEQDKLLIKFADYRLLEEVLTEIKIGFMTGGNVDDILDYAKAIIYDRP